MKVALVGSAPASVRLAPYGDPSWAIYGCSPGVYGIASRVTEWFELHLWEPGQTWFSPEYVQWMTGLPDRGATLWVGGPVPIPGSKIYPFDAVMAEYDPKHWFCSSSLFWMMARAMEAIKEEALTEGRAISPDRDKIGLFGVDMAAGEEYEMQRAGIHFLAYRAAAMGIEVGVPPESDLFTPRFRYGADEWTHSFRKMRSRRQELEARRDQAKAALKQYEQAEKFFEGALEDLKYCHDTWASKDAHLGVNPLVLQSSGTDKVPDIGAIRPGGEK
jgi:hypothetical protein